MDSAPPLDSDKSVKHCDFVDCKIRISKLDPHSFCAKHIGFLCNWDKRCNECLDWTDSVMESYLRNRKKLLGARLRKEKYKARFVGNEEFASDITLSDSRSLSPVSSVSASSVTSKPLPSDPKSVLSPSATPTDSPKAQGVAGFG